MGKQLKYIIRNKKRLSDDFIYSGTGKHLNEMTKKERKELVLLE